MTDREEVERRHLRPSEAYRSSLIFKLSLSDTTGSLRRQLGVEVLDDEDRVADASAARLAQLGQEYAQQALQATLGTSEDTPIMTNQPATQEGPAFRPLPGFSAEAAMPDIGDRNDYRLAA
jgi:hypothetical protein